MLPLLEVETWSVCQGDLPRYAKIYFVSLPCQTVATKDDRFSLLLSMPMPLSLSGIHAT